MAQHPQLTAALLVQAAGGASADPRLRRLDPERGELVGGMLACRLPPSTVQARVVAGLAERLRGGRVADGTRLLERPLLRLGIDDIWRPPLVLVAAGATTSSVTLRGGPFGRRGRSGAREQTFVRAEGALLVVEFGTVSQLALARLSGYAGAGVREVWELDLVEAWTVAYRSPWGGAYRSRSLWYPGEEVPLSSLPGASVCALPAPSNSSTNTSPATSTRSP